MINNEKIEIFNGIALLKDDQCICRFIRESGRLDHDQNMLPLLKEFIKKDSIVLDIGAFIGDHTIYYSKLVGGNGRVIAFEPYKDSFECLLYNLNGYKNIDFHNYALGNIEHYVSMEFVETNNGMNYISMAREANYPKIKITTLDTISQNFNKLDFIKIDVEGCELDVLIGGKSVINKFKPAMLIEINDMTLERQGVNRQQIFDWLTENNYTYRNIYKNKDLKDSQLDIICLPK